MRNLLLAAALTVQCFLIPVAAQTIYDIDTRATLHRDGSATIVQDWDVSPAYDNTEWYVAVDNLGKNMKVDGFSVSENGRNFTYEGRDWDIHRSLEKKSGRCGIVDKGDGVELCWGIGSTGRHKWTITYTLTGLVKSMDDYDAFNHQFVGRDIQLRPEHARVVIDNDFGAVFDTSYVRVWGFGTRDGSIGIHDGKIVCETYSPIPSGGSVTLMCRFDKGTFSPAVSDGRPFSDMQKKAFKNSDYQQKTDIGEILAIAASILLLFGWIFWMIIETARGNKYAKSLFGTRKIKGWFRDTPLEGNLPASQYVLKYASRFGVAVVTMSNLIGAFFLRWIMDKTVSLQKDPRNAKKTKLVFTHAPDDSSEENPVNSMGDAEKSLYEMAWKASGDGVLESREFKRWSQKHAELVAGWPKEVESEGYGFLVEKGFLKNSKKATETGAEKMRNLIEFRNFLHDFTLSSQREATEVGLWKDYLVFAQLFGIADKVAKQFEKLYPQEFEQLSNELGVNSANLLWYVNYNQGLSASAYQGLQNAMSSGEVRGFGGGMSFGGGGGFSGGGGGGGR